MDWVQCNHCSARLHPQSSRCSECKCAYYCSAKCQTDDWSNKHNFECIGMKSRREELERKTAERRAQEAQEIQKRAAERLKQAALARLKRPSAAAVENEDPEKEEGHQRRLQRYREEAEVVVGPGEIVYLRDRRRYGVGIERNASGDPYPMTAAGYIVMRGKFSFLQDTDGQVFRRQYVVPDVGRPVFSDDVWWETYNRKTARWEPLGKRVDPETNVKWEIYLP